MAEEDASQGTVRALNYQPRPSALSRSDMRLRVAALAGEGRSLGEMSAALGVSRQALLRRLQRDGLHAEWKSARARSIVKEHEGKSARVTRLAQFAGQLYAHALHSAEKAGWPYVKTLEIHLGCEYQFRHEPGKLLVVFTAYEDATRDGGLPSLRGLARRSGLAVGSIQTLMRAAGLPTAPCHLTAEQRAALHRVRDAPMGIEDLAYFGRFNPDTIRHYISPRSRVSQRGRPADFTYARASQVLEAMEAGFAHDEIAELVGVRHATVAYVERNQESITDLVLTVLSRLEPGRPPRPYRSGPP